MNKNIYANAGETVGEGLKKHTDASTINHYITVYTENGIRKVEAWLQIGENCFSVVNTIINDEVK